MTDQMVELMFQDTDTSKGLVSMRAFKFSKKDKQKLLEEAKNFKDWRSTLRPLEFQVIQPTTVDSHALPQDFLQKYFNYLSIPLEDVTFDKEKIHLLEEGWTTLLARARAVAVPAMHEVFERERQAFLRIKESLLDDPEFRGKFVAIYQGEIIGQDEDNRELARRVYSERGYVPIYIGKVERERRVIEMPSPEVL